MKTVIIYATKYGCTEKAAKILQSKMGNEVLLVNVAKEPVPFLDGYDAVILGGSIYIGKIQKKLISYITQNLPELQKKRIGLFICAGSPDPAARIKELENVFPDSLYQQAVAKEVFGYELHYEKLNFLEKTIMRTVAGSKENSSGLSEETIERFAKTMTLSQ